MPHYLNLALDNGVKPAEISELITHLAFYSGRGNAMSAVAVTKDVFAKRGVRSEQLAQVSPKLLPLNEKREAERAKRVGEQFGNVSPGVVQYTTEVLFLDLWLRPDLAPARSQPGHHQLIDRFGPGGAAFEPPQSRNGQRADSGPGVRGADAPRLLRRLAKRLLRAARGQGRVREAEMTLMALPP